MATTTSGFQRIGNEKNSELKKAQEISYKSLVEDVRRTFLTGKTKNVSWRRQQLIQLRKLVTENHERITEAVRKDHAGPKLRGVYEMSMVNDIALHLDNLDAWAANEPVKNNSLLGRSYVRKEPKGVVLVIAPWNFPFAMVFDGLVSIIAAGNCCIMKPSEVSVHSCEVIADLIPKYLDNDCFKVVTGGIPETTALLREKFNHILYTGNGHVGRIVMTAAAKHLTPVTLELGGKSPVYVDKSARVDMAALRVAQFKWVNVGQICIAPDYVLVHETVADEFKQKVIDFVKKRFGKTVEERMKNPNYGRVINSRHVGRIKTILNKSGGKVLIGGSEDAEQKFFDTTILENPSLEDAILKEEIFGPILVVLSVRGVEEAVERINKICPDPLSLYIFSEDQKATNHVLDNTTSGGVCINSTVEHQANHHLPFGGVGESGVGKYHGKWGFDEFTHFRSVLVRDSFISRGATIPLPPYTDKLYDLAVKFAVIGLFNFTPLQKKMLKYGGMAAALAVGFKILKSKL